jgi:hypothetical protein
MVQTTPNKSKARRVGEAIRFWSMVVGSVVFGVGMVMCSMTLVEQTVAEEGNRIYKDMDSRVSMLENQVNDYGSDNEEYR